MNRSLLIILALFITVSCTNNDSITQFKPTPATIETINVYLYRPVTMANAIYNPQILIDNEVFESIKNGDVTKISLSPGNYILSLQIENRPEMSTTQLIETVPGQNLYYRIQTSLKLKPGNSFKSYERKFSLAKVSAHTAASEITECCTKPVQPVKTEAEKTGAIDQQPGFNVDRTLNPFSH